MGCVELGPGDPMIRRPSEGNEREIGVALQRKANGVEAVSYTSMIRTNVTTEIKRMGK